MIYAEAVRLTGSNFVVSGQRMRIQLPQGLVEFDGPVTATLADVL
jgi:lipopolysaccharide export system protein LptC